MGEIPSHFFIMINIRINYTRPFDNIPTEGVLVERFTHTNKGYGVTKDIALIYYNDFVNRNTERPVFRYVEASDDRLKIYENEKSIYEAPNKIMLMNKYTPKSCFIKEWYIEDWLYNFVNYNNIKI